MLHYNTGFTGCLQLMLFNEEIKPETQFEKLDMKYYKMYFEKEK